MVDEILILESSLEGRQYVDRGRGEQCGALLGHPLDALEKLDDRAGAVCETMGMSIGFEAQATLAPVEFLVVLPDYHGGHGHGAVCEGEVGWVAVAPGGLI